MVGKNVISISGPQFAAGLCTSDNLADGGIGTSSSNLNLIGSPGAVRATYSYNVTLPAVTPTQFIASAEDASATTSFGRIAVDGSGNWYKLTQNTITSPTRGTSVYFDPVTDMVAFNNFNFATTSTNIARFNPSTNSLSEAYWTSTCGQSALNANVPHSLLVYQGFMWLGVANKLYSITTGDVATTMLTLDANEIIISLGIDPGSGLMMIGVGTVSDGSETFGGRYFIELYNGYSSKVIRKIPIEGRPSGFQSVGGAVFVGVDNTITQWNGNGVTFLRRLTNPTYSSGDQITKQRMAAMQNTLIVADGKDILAYGDIQNGRKVWYPLYSNSYTSKTNNVIGFLGNNTGASAGLSPIIVAFTTSGSTGVAYYIEPFNLTAATGTFYTNTIYFPRPVNIYDVEVLTTGITSTGGIGGIAMIDEEGNVVTPTTSTFVVASGTRKLFRFSFAGRKFRSLQPKLTIDTQAYGVAAMNIYYGVSE